MPDESMRSDRSDRLRGACSISNRLKRKRRRRRK